MLGMKGKPVLALTWSLLSKQHHSVLCASWMKTLVHLLTQLVLVFSKAPKLHTLTCANVRAEQYKTSVY